MPEASLEAPGVNFISPETARFLEETSRQRTGFRLRWRYYYQDNTEFFKTFTEEGKATLIFGADALKVAEGLTEGKIYVLPLGCIPGETPSDPRIEMVQSVEEAFRKGPIRYVLLPYTLQMLDDIQDFLTVLHAQAQPETRIVALQYNFFWAPVLKLAQKWRFRSRTPDQNWLNNADLRNLFTVSNYQEIRGGGRCLIPFYIPLITRSVNRYLASLPGFQWLCQKHYFIARPMKRNATLSEATVTVVVPARNEQGNIAGILDRLPAMGPRCEVVFVEGHSKDDTWSEIQRQVAAHSRRTEFSLKAFQQTGEGKADAVRLGFSRATGDILMILDADLSVPPEDLDHFYNALLSRTAEFLNGSRLVYQMESAAMQTLNLFFNKVFAVLVSLMIGQPVKDTLCGTKALFRADYERIRRQPDTFGALDPFGDFELLFGSAYLNLKICDVPIRYKQRTYGSTNIRRFRHGWELVKVCWSCWSYLK